MQPIVAVTVDLDDTLFPQSAFLDGAWTAVADAGCARGLAREPLHAALRARAALGSDRGGIIDGALADVGADPALAEPLVAAFRAYQPATLPPYPGVREALAELRRVVPVGCVTDGHPAVQRVKLAALGLSFDAVVISDELDRRLRKPHPAPFRAALHRLGACTQFAVHVGDRPAKDLAGAARAGMRAVRVATGEYAAEPDEPVPWGRFPDATSALQFLAAASRAGRATSGGMLSSWKAS